MKVLNNYKHDKIQEALKLMNWGLLDHDCHDLEFYMFFLNHVSFYEAEMKTMPTMAAGMHRNRLAIFWTKGFVESLDIREVIAVLIHEAYHLLSNHNSRGIGRDPLVSNIAMDMIINHLLIKYHGKHVRLPILTQAHFDKEVAEAKEAGHEIDPKALAKMKERIGKTYCVELDPNYKGDLIYEPLYNWLMEEWSKENNGQSNELSEQTKEMMKNAEARRGMTLDYHGELSEIDEQLRRSLAGMAREKAKYDAKRTRTVLPGCYDEILDVLLKEPKKNNIKQLKRMISNLKGREKQRTYTRLNRRVEGVKGNRKQSLAINVILDTSGSMGNDFEIALTEIFVGGYHINLVQCDTQVTRVDKITDRKQLNKLKIAGLGGTVIQPAVDYVLDIKNKMSKFPTVILSDAATDILDFKGTMNQFLLLSTTNTHIPYVNGQNIKSLIIEH